MKHILEFWQWLCNIFTGTGKATDKPIAEVVKTPVSTQAHFPATKPASPRTQAYVRPSRERRKVKAIVAVGEVVSQKKAHLACKAGMRAFNIVDRVEGTFALRRSGHPHAGVIRRQLVSA